MIYDLNYFIGKFERLREEQFCKNHFVSADGAARCANGHCGMTGMKRDDGYITAEAAGLQKVFSVLPLHNWNGRPIEDSGDYSTKAACINNGDAIEYQQPTPKQRILAALYDIKALTEKQEVKEKIVYVVVPVTITEQAKDMVLS